MPEETEGTSLSDSAKLAIKTYLSQYEVAVEERQHKRVLRAAAIGGLVAASVAGLAAWALLTTAVNTARSTSETYLKEVTQGDRLKLAAEDARIKIQLAVDGIGRIREQNERIEKELEAAVRRAKQETSRAVTAANAQLRQIEDRERELSKAGRILDLAKSTSEAMDHVARLVMEDSEFRANIAKIVGPNPTGAVVAFDLPSGCPAGWEAAEEYKGRTIVGAGQGSNLMNRPFRQAGGAEGHKLSVEEMPQHQHTVNLPRDVVTWPNRLGHASPILRDQLGGQNTPAGADARGGSTISEATGGSAPFPIMPPYIALHLCRKA